MLKTFSLERWNEPITETIQQEAITELENGKILYFPELSFKLLPEEQIFLSSNYADPHAKNISYCPKRRRLWGVCHVNDKERSQLKMLLERYSRYTAQLLEHLLPQYTTSLIYGRTSYRPVQIKGRKTSMRKDDKRLHVDAFPSAPNQGQRLLRVFCNINPHNEARFWQVGESFETVAKTFLPQLSAPRFGSAWLLRLLKITKSLRSPYDHYMLQIHDYMKKNSNYQKTAIQKCIAFDAGSTWIVYTDDVSHAALEGQYVLEQTFCLPVTAMQSPEKSPLHVLERLLQQSLT